MILLIVVDYRGSTRAEIGRTGVEPHGKDSGKSCYTVNHLNYDGVSSRTMTLGMLCGVLDGFDEERYNNKEK